MNGHYILAFDRGHLRVYAETVVPGQSKPRLDIVEAMDFPAAKQNYTGNETDSAGRFPGSDGRTGGMSIDERLPLQGEELRREAGQIADQINQFFAERPQATWDLAAAPELYAAMIDDIAPDLRRRLKRVLSKDLVNHNPEDLLAHFVSPEPQA